MPVPRGFSVTTSAFERFLGSCPDRAGLVELWSRCAAGDMERIPKLSRDAQGLLAEASMPPAVREAVLAAWREMPVMIGAGIVIHGLFRRACRRWFMLRQTQEWVVAREYGLPAVVNVPLATQIIRTGQVIRVDGDQGTISVVSD